MNKLHTAILATSVLVLGVLGFSGTAFAQSVDVEAEAVGLVTDGFSQLTPVIIGVAGAALGLLVLSVALRMAWRAISSRGKASPA